MSDAALSAFFDRYSTVGPHTVIFSYDSGLVEFNTNHAASESWCRRHLKLYAAPALDAFRQSERFEFRHVALPVGEISGHVDRLAFDRTVPLYSKRLGKACRVPDGCNLIASNTAREGPRLYLRQGSQVLLLSEEGDPSSKLECARIIRDIIRRQRENAGFLVVHASCVGGHGGGLLFVGPKYSGKSSSLLACLTSGMDMVGNDRVYIGSSAAGLEARAWVSTTNLSLGAFQEFPSLRKLLNRDYIQTYPMELRENSQRFWDDIDLREPASGAANSRSDKVVLVDDEVAEAFGVHHVERAELRAVVFPSVVPGASSPSQRHLNFDETYERLERETWSLMDETYFPDVFGLGVLTREAMTDNLKSQVRRAHQAMPCIRLETGFSHLSNAMSEVIQIVK